MSTRRVAQKQKADNNMSGRKPNRSAAASAGATTKGGKTARV